MIRRNFLKALCASPLGFLVRKKETDLTLAQLEKCRDELPPTALADNGIPSWTTGTSSTREYPLDTTIETATGTFRYVQYKIS